MSKSISNIIECDSKQDWQILITFGANIFDNWPLNDHFSNHLI